MASKVYYRRDGVRITHDPFAKGMKEKYGAQGSTDADGFDPYADSVGAGIYGGRVLYDEHGDVVIGRQYQNHNPTPGPLYSGEGYTSMSRAMSDGPAAVLALLGTDPDAVHEISTGGATPLHMAGMSQRNQLSTALLIERGGDIEALDTYGYTPLHRMASNNLAVGAEALLQAGADANTATSHGETAISIAQSSHAHEVAAVLRRWSSGAGAK